MEQITILLILSICLVLLVIFLLVCYSDYRKIRKENQQFGRALEDHFVMQSNSLDAYRAMTREACRERGFWENNGEDGGEEY